MTTPSLDVSVVICVRNGAASIIRQLDALDAQVDAPPFEIIIGDNGSTDATAQVVRSWMDSGDHPARLIRLVDVGTKPGIPRARNRAASFATGRIVAFCDADDRVAPQWVRLIADNAPQGGLMGGRILAETKDGQPRPDAFPDGLPFNGFLPFIPNGNLAIDRALLDGLQGFDESLPAYGYEDVDLSWRAQLSDRPLNYVPDATITMVLSSPSRALRKRFLLGQGRILMAHRYPQYDSRSYTLLTCTRDLAHDLWLTARVVSSKKTRSQARRAGSVTVASAGMLWGVIRYGLLGYPPPHLATTPSVPAQG